MGLENEKNQLSLEDHRWQDDLASSKRIESAPRIPGITDGHTDGSSTDDDDYGLVRL